MSEFDLLLQKYIAETLSPADWERLVVLARQPENEALLQQKIAERMEDADYTDFTDGVKADLLFARAMQKAAAQAPARVVKRAFVWRMAAAAVLLLLAGGAGWLFLTKDKQHQTAVRQSPKDIPPGKTGAVLTLADGREIELDSAGNGVIANQQGTTVQLKDGLLAYDARLAGSEIIYNTLSTPKGRQFNVLLPDGTSVWLNSGSSIRYPNVFAAKERRVVVTGEAYFEVTGSKSKPFIVQVNEHNSVQVLGTRFNINAYDDEALIRTTLLDGSVRVEVKGETGKSKADAVVLLPGQQSRVPAGKLQTGIKTDYVDIDKVMAWRRGFFNFEDAGMEEVMRQLARWYDLEVVYEGKIPDIVFGGELSRNINLSGVLKALEDSKVHFRIEGRKIIIQP